MNINEYESWGRYPKHKPCDVEKIFWRSDLPDLSKYDKPILAYGCGKSYGDSCLNDGGILLDIRGMDKLISFDTDNGIIKCEAGFTLAELLEIAVPRGWFPASTPGTKYITVGGALANDVHGKNHHKGGTFGCHVISFELVRSDGTRIICSQDENPVMYAATIGGLGLTGLITWVEFQLKACDGPYFDMEAIKYNSLDEFFEINEESEKYFDYTVAWVDTTASDGNLGRGIYNRGNHATNNKKQIESKGQIPFPIEAPFINSFSVKAFNTLYFWKQAKPIERQTVHYDPFFYPLDAVANWNKAYGKNGFLQYQFVIPFENDSIALKRILKKIANSGMSSFLTVIKTFGDIKSPGMLSFPRPGVNMAIDFRMQGPKTLEFLRKLDEIVVASGGAIYPAKDARMSAEDFKAFYPNWQEFSKYIDPAFSSSFWRRVAG